jgi:steroid delta-isomerase-like uncharacterized protein
MTPEEVRAIIRRGVQEGPEKGWTPKTLQAAWDDIYINGNLALMNEMFAADYVRHDAAQPGIKDLESYLKHITAIRESYPDIRVTIEDSFAAGNRRATRWTWAGTQTGVSPATGLPPTGKHVAFTGITFARIGPDGKAVEEWMEYDMLGLLKQLGFVLTPPEPKK